jgi:hypothetical protein
MYLADMRPVFVLLIAFSIVSCEKKNDSTGEVSVWWDNNKAIAVSINRSLFPANNPDSILRNLKISVRGSDYGVLGSTSFEQDIVIFTPAVHFERGLTYNIFFGSDSISSFTIPLDTAIEPPRVVASYPSCDTVPENLLKIYLSFSQSMMEGRSSLYVRLFDSTTGDTVDGAFLDLQPELWNEDQTVLSLWFDPGRIKQDLIPNKELGAVLAKGHRYRLVVLPGWRSKGGLKVDASYTRDLTTRVRDSAKPDVTQWSVEVTDQVIIRTNESLDWSLLPACISVHSEAQEVKGTIAIEDCERRIVFTPNDKLTAGTYHIGIESRLEDLAGNNLNRLFETDITDAGQISGNKPFYRLTFVVR